MPETLLQQFERLEAGGCADLFSFLSSQAGSSVRDKLPVVLHHLRKRWTTGDLINVEDYLARLPEIAGDPQAVLQLAVAEYTARVGSGRSPDMEELMRRFPQLAIQLKHQLGKNECPPPAGRAVTSTQSVSPNQAMSELLNGRYRVVRQLGEGAFGQVFLAFDEDLQRHVAVKIPSPDRFQRSEDADLYLSEARTVASLSHPHIVPVYDMGRTPQGFVFVVSRFIEGGTLEEIRRLAQMSFEASARVLQTIAEALHSAHVRRLVHRDVKPANILIEESTNTAFITDFGLAVREEDYAGKADLAGTPAYMSPEQARGEGHRLDGRSDVFSLGVILYELITGQHPFCGNTTQKILHQVISAEPKLPRSVRNDVPEELERICLKAMSKHASARFSTAAGLAEDLEAWLCRSMNQSRAGLAEVPVVPKGLRSFDAGDADFFPDLLPGPRNRDGLPESIAFWKRHLEQTDAELTFTVGLIYGPSGCGKSSLVKAGLLPHLSQDIVAIYVEATADDTETRILRRLKSRLPELPESTGLTETLAEVRRSCPGKVVIIIDQFEQWLHSHRMEADAELINALRQCDGGRLQAVVMVRDDFAMATVRLMEALDVPIQQGKNFATVDLFDIEHATRVLTKFGRAFGKLPTDDATLSPDQQHFVTSVAADLSRDGKVVCVRLTLFAELVKNKRWIPATLEQTGGTDGIGVSFLEETFALHSANPVYGIHAVAARKMLQALMPDPGMDIRGNMISSSELLRASGYQDHPARFAELLRILDTELRLITPTDPEGRDGGELPESNPISATGQFYQLTHDYLVPALKTWLTQKQRETRKGRAELTLAERSVLWNSKWENRNLPGAMELLAIRFLTNRREWTPPQQRMMQRSARYYGTRALGMASALALLALLFTGIYKWGREERLARMTVLGTVQLQQREREAALQMALETGGNQLRLKRYPDALTESQRISGLLETGETKPSLKQKAERFIQNVGTVFDLEQARIQRCGMPHCQFDYGRSSPEVILRRAGLNFSEATAEQLVGSVTDSLIRDEIVSAMDDWSWVLFEHPDDSMVHLLPKLIDLCCLADPDPLRVSLRRCLVGDTSELPELAAEAARAVSPKDAAPASLLVIANALAHSGNVESAISLMTRADEVHPANFWVNLRLAELNRLLKPARYDLSCHYLQLARVLRPENPVVINNLVVAYTELGKLEAATDLQESLIRLQPEDPRMGHHLGIILTEREMEAEAISVYEELLLREPEYIPALINLAILHLSNDRLTVGEQLLTKARNLSQVIVDQNPEDYGASYNLGLIDSLMANVCVAHEKMPQALAFLDQSIARLRAASARLNDDRVVTNLENMLRKRADWAREMDDTRGAIGFLLQAAELEGAEQKGLSYIQIAKMKSELGLSSEALQYAEKACTHLPPDDQMHANVLYLAACVIAGNGGHAAVVSPATVPDSVKLELRAVAMLQQAADVKYFAPIPFASMIQSNPAFQSLRECSEFHLLLLNLYRRGFADSPKLTDTPKQQHRYHAACEALLASSGRSLANPEFNAADRWKLRDTAYRWLKDELKAIHASVSNNLQPAADVSEVLDQWRDDPDLAASRDEQLLKTYPAPEKDAWEKLWSAVESLKGDAQAELPELPDGVTGD